MRAILNRPRRVPRAVVFVLVSLLVAFAAEPASAALTFDLRAVSGSKVTFHSPKSVAVTQDSVGGWINFELYASVDGANDTANDDSIHSFAGNIFSTQFGRGAAGGSMINSGEIAPRVPRGLVPPMDGFGSSNGWLQNLDDDSDLEIGGTGWRLLWGAWVQSPQGMIAGRGNPFRVRDYVGDGAVAEFLLYRFRLRIESILAQELGDLTSIYFSPAPHSPTGLWFEDGIAQGTVGGGVIHYGQNVLIHTAQTPEELAIVPEPASVILIFVSAGALLLVVCRLNRRRPR